MKPIDMIPEFAPKRQETKNPENRTWNISVTPPDIIGGKKQSLVLTDDQYHRYRAWRDKGVMIQDALPELTISQREILMTGLGDDDFHASASDDDADYA